MGKLRGGGLDSGAVGSTGRACPLVTEWVPLGVQRFRRLAEYSELVSLFFIQGAAMGMWAVPLSTVLDAHGLKFLRPYAFATTSIAAFVAPLFFGAMADRHVSPVKVLRFLSAGAASAMALASFAIGREWPWWWVMVVIQVHALFSSPSWSIASTIVFARLSNSRRQFGPIRAMATLGWMAGCLVVSALNADRSVLSGFSGSVAWLGVCGLTFLLPAVDPAPTGERVTLRQRFGLDALALLKNRDHRGVFATAALLNIPLAAFYPHTPPHLRELGFEHTSAWMSMGQITEMLAMFGLAGLLTRWRLKWIFGVGLSMGVLRFALASLDTPFWVMAGVTLHGCSYALVFITGQIYLDERVDPAWRARAQALLYLLTSGMGNLVGFLGTGWWLRMCESGARMNWSRFWGGLAGVVGCLLVYFLATYRGREEESSGVRKH